MAADRETETETKTVEVPAAYVERARPDNYARFNQPVVRFSNYESPQPAELYFNTIARDALGDPDGLRCFFQEERMALLPTDPDHPNAYRLVECSGVRMTGQWLKRELPDGHPAEGIYELERDGDLWIVDFGAEPLEVR